MPSGSKPGDGAAPKPSRSHSLRVVDDLGLSIVSGQQPEGSLLPGDVELLERFGVSRTVLREALKTLAAKGMVQARARVGTRVRPRGSWNLFDAEVLKWHVEVGLQPDFFVHLAEIRMVLEPEAAAYAALRSTPADLREINDWADRMAERGIDRETFAHADLGFHLAVARSAHNPFFISISSLSLIEVVLVAMLTVSSPADEPDRLAASVAQHRRIAKAIADRNADDARRTMREVIQNGLDNAREGDPQLR
jgi:DNA-binding FadR family transcriptional regulator